MYTLKDVYENVHYSILGTDFKQIRNILNIQVSEILNKWIMANICITWFIVFKMNNLKLHMSHRQILITQPRIK